MLPTACRMLGCVVLLPLLTAGAWVVPLGYRTDSPSVGDLDSVAIWAVADSALLFVTDKLENSVEVHDPTTNTWLMDFVAPGAPGGLARPNGIAVVQGLSAGGPTRDILLIVERDHARVSVFDLPGLEYLGSIGSGLMTQPLGIAVHRQGNAVDIWVTDDGSETVFVFDVTADDTSVTGSLDFSFGINTVLESIVVDADNQRVVISDEGTWDLLVYDLQGTFQQRLGTGLFVGDPEGLALVDLCDGAGYLIATDQNAFPTQFEVFDRQSLEWLGCFAGVTTGTDGVTFTSFPLPNFPGGSFYAHRSGSEVDAYDWNAIAAACTLGVLQDCSGPTDVGPPDVGPPTAPTLPALTAHHEASARQVTLELAVESATAVDLVVFDVRGHRVRTLARRQPVAPGTSTWLWDLQDDRRRRVSPGVYWARAVLAGRPSHARIVLTGN